MHIIGSKRSGGAERFFLRLTTALAGPGHRVFTVTPPASALNHGLAPSVDRDHVPMRGVWDVASRLAIRRHVASLAPDIVQTYLGRATRLTHIASLRGPVHVARLGGYYDLKGYRHAAAWVGNTRGICDYLLRNGLPAERVFHIGNFVAPPRSYSTEDLARLRSNLSLPDAALVLLFVGRLHPNKGLSDLLTAFAMLRARRASRPLHLIVVGDGPSRDELQSLARDIEVGPWLHWVGWQDDPQPYYALADIFVCPSRHEPLGNVVLEAWNHELPVVASRIQGPAELITAGTNGLLVPPADAAALAGTLEDLLAADTQARHALGAAGNLTLRTHHNEHVVTQGYLAMYEALADRG